MRRVAWTVGGIVAGYGALAFSYAGTALVLLSTLALAGWLLRNGRLSSGAALLFGFGFAGFASFSVPWVRSFADPHMALSPDIPAWLGLSVLLMLAGGAIERRTRPGRGPAATTPPGAVPDDHA